MSSNVKILICDDSALIRKKLKEELNEIGNIEVLEADNGEKAIEMYKKELPSMVFMDIVMPEKDGIQSAREIIQFDNEAKIIMLSSVGTKTNLKGALEAGACDFIQKPWYKLQIKSIVNKII